MSDRDRLASIINDEIRRYLSSGYAIADVVLADGWVRLADANLEAACRGYLEASLGTWSTDANAVDKGQIAAALAAAFERKDDRWELL